MDMSVFGSQIENVFIPMGLSRVWRSTELDSLFFSYIFIKFIGRLVNEII